MVLQIFRVLPIIVFVQGQFTASNAHFPTLFVNVPIQSQALPIARSGVPFNFALSPYTFAVAPRPRDRPHATHALAYTAILPAWASFDPITLSIVGTPPSDASDAFPARISAALALPLPANTTSPSIVTLRADADFVLRVNPSSAPKLDIGLSLAVQLRYGGPARVSGATPFPAASPTGVRIPPGWSFSIGLDPRTFTGTPTFYTAGLAPTLTDPLLPLPPWLIFSPELLTFSGVAASEPVPRTYSIVLAASTTPATRDVAVPFMLLVAGSEGEPEAPCVANGAALPPFFLMSGAPAVWALIPEADLRIDGRPLLREDMTNVSVQLNQAPWLQWDMQALTLSGTPSAPGKSSVAVSITTTTNRTIVAALPITVYHEPFAPMPRVPLVVVLGTPFSWHVPLAGDVLYSTSENESLLAELIVNASWEPTVSWLAYDGAARTLTGTPTAESPASTIVVTLTATLRVLLPAPILVNTSQDTDVVYPAATTDLLSHASVTLVVRPPLSSPGTNTTTEDVTRRVLAVVLPILAVLAALLAALLVWRFHRMSPKSERIVRPALTIRTPPKFETLGARDSAFFACAGPDSMHANTSHVDDSGDYDSSMAHLMPEGKHAWDGPVAFPLAAVTRPPISKSELASSTGARDTNDTEATYTPRRTEVPPATPPRRLALMRMFRSLSLSHTDVERTAATMSPSARSFPALSSSESDSSLSSASSGYVRSPPPSVPRRRADFLPPRRISDGVERSLRADVEARPTSSVLSCEDIIAEYADAVDATYHCARVVAAPALQEGYSAVLAKGGMIGAGKEVDDVFGAGAGSVPTHHPPSLPLSRSTIRLVTQPVAPAYSGKPRVVSRAACEVSWLELDHA